MNFLLTTVYIADILNHSQACEEAFKKMMIFYSVNDDFEKIEIPSPCD